MPQFPPKWQGKAPPFLPTICQLLNGKSKTGARRKKEGERICAGEQSILASQSLLLYPFSMFELIAPQLTTAAEKLTHLRRFL
jgi:hypothetical protein